MSISNETITMLSLELYIRSLVWFMDETQMDGEKDKKKLASMATVTT